MVDVKELRIGNWVSYLGNNTRTNSISVEDNCGYVSILCSGIIGQNQIEPIPLTEELLLKCGFGKGYDKGDETDGVFNRSCFYVMYGRKAAVSFRLDKDKLYVMLDKWKYIQIEYLHQLQNIYYALTGEELEVEL